MKQTDLSLFNRDDAGISCNNHRDAVSFNIGDDSELYLFKRFYPPAEADSLFDALLTDIAWREEHIVIFKKRVKAPRLMCWYGDPEAYYRYSGVDHKPMPWTLPLLDIKEQIEKKCRSHFNSVLANCYRDGNDSMGCHSDDEKELGVNPVIASLSLGDERVFKMHHKKTNGSLIIPLCHGDLLVMGGACQQHWRHSVPKTKTPKGLRINLTFRKILPL